MVILSSVVTTYQLYHEQIETFKSLISSSLQVFKFVNPPLKDVKGNCSVESLGVLVSVKLNINLQCVLAAQKGSCILVMNQKKRDQHVEGGDCAALLHSHETQGSIGFISGAPKTRNSVRLGLEKGLEDGQRAGEPLMQGS